MANYQNGLLQHGAVVTLGGVHLKVQEKHYYDFTVHYTKVSDVGPFQKVQSTVRTETLLIVEVASHPNAAQIKKCLNDALNLKYETSLVYFI